MTSAFLPGKAPFEKMQVLQKLRLHLRTPRPASSAHLFLMYILLAWSTHLCSFCLAFRLKNWSAQCKEILILDLLRKKKQVFYYLSYI